MKLLLKCKPTPIDTMHSLLKIWFPYFLRTRWDFDMCLSVFCWNSFILPMWDTVIRNFDFNWISSWSLFTDFQNASLLLLALISHKISQKWYYDWHSKVAFGGLYFLVTSQILENNHYFTVLIFTGSKFCEFHKFNVDREIYTREIF